MKGFFQLVGQLFWWFITLLVVLLVVSFALKNQQTVELAYYFDFKIQVPLWLVPLAGIFVGAILGVFLTTAWVLRAKQQATTERRKARKFEQEIAHIRSLPAQEEK